MIFLVSGGVKEVLRAAQRYPGRLGLITTPRNWNAVQSLADSGLPWAADNGAYSGLDAGAFRGLLARLPGARRCLFVAAPDVVGDAAATLGLWAAWRDEVALAGQPVAFVAQNGAGRAAVPWDDFGCLFLGGSPECPRCGWVAPAGWRQKWCRLCGLRLREWKLGPAASALAAEAKARGKWLHMGRVNTRRRMRAALHMGCDSVDGSAASRWRTAFLLNFCRWLTQIHNECTLPGMAHEPAPAGPDRDGG